MLVLPVEVPMTIPNEYCEHLASCPQCQSFIDQLSDNPEMRRWAPARQSLVGSEPSEPVLERLLEELRSTPLPDNCRPEGVGEPAGASLAFLEPPRQAGDLGALGSYRVLAELARGGMGIVLLAYDANLQRKVALKVLPPYRADEQARNRFVREAQAAAGIDHDNVGPVYAVANPADGPPYLVMQYVEGLTLREQIKKEGRLNPLGAAKMAAQVAEGLAAAHDAGLIHRDIKPGNIILDRAHGRAKIMDFGLVRLTYLPGTTQEGMLMGTPEYMSPEQVRDPEHLDARTDIYSLGVTLYEALTGEVPCRGVAHMVHQQILQDEPRPPRRLNDRIPRDLETICLQCLRKEPGQRYASARALADDLQRFLRSEPVRARPVSPWERGWRWARRNAPLTATGAVAAAALVAGVIVSVLFAVREFREHELAQRRLAESYMERAFTFGGQEQDYARGLLWLARALETAPEPAADLQQTIRASLSAWRREIFPLKAILPHPFAVLAAALSPDGRTVLTGGQDKTARLWDVVTAKALSPPLPHQDRIWAVAFSPDGRTILTGSYDRTAQRWHAATGEPIGEPLWHPAEVRAVTFSPDGRTILTGCFDGIARLWDAATGEPLGPPMPHPGGINAVTFSPDGRTIVTGGRDRMVRLWDATSGQAVGAPLPCDGEVRVVAFSPDGRTILTAGPEQPTRLWDVTTRSIVLSLPRQYIFSAAFSSDGKAVLTGGLAPARS